MAGSLQIYDPNTETNITYNSMRILGSSPKNGWGWANRSLENPVRNLVDELQLTQLQVSWRISGLAFIHVLAQPKGTASKFITKNNSTAGTTDQMIEKNLSYLTYMRETSKSKTGACQTDEFEAG